MIFLFLINPLISFVMCSTPRLWKYVTILPLTYNKTLIEIKHIPPILHDICWIIPWIDAFEFRFILEISFRRGYSVSKRLVKLARFQDFPSQLLGYQDLPPSVIICVELSTLIYWLGAHQCKISWRLHLSKKTQYWLTVNSAKHQ